MRLRNPWGKGEFNGAYSDHSPIWSDKLRRELSFKDVREDGVFHIAIEDFVQYFEDVFVAHYKESYHLSSVKDVNGAGSFACYQFNIKEAGDVYFGVSQPDKNMLPESHNYGKNLSLLLNSPLYFLNSSFSHFPFVVEV